jgi:D-alanyl-D-alanine carboxypeptidase (penicillin-binding protein 5/6)
LILFALILLFAADYLHALKATYKLLPGASATFSSQTSSPTVAWPAYGQSALGIEGNGIVAAQGGNAPLPTASVAKLVTALTVLAKYPFDLPDQGQTITLTQNDVLIYEDYLKQDGSVVKVVEGEKITEYEALQAMLLPSSNNIADSLADWAFGSIPNYAVYANKYVESLRMTNTHITSSSGFDPTTTSTAADLVILGEAALKNPVIASIVDAPSATLPVAGVVHNVNSLIGQDGIIGIKTGNTVQDLGVYLFASVQNVPLNQTATIFGAVMGGPSLTKTMSDSLTLINSAVSNLKTETIIKKGQIVDQYYVPWTKHYINVAAASNLQAVGWKSIGLNAKLSLRHISGPINIEQNIGNASAIGVNGNISTINLRLAQPLNKPSLKWRLIHI